MPLPLFFLSMPLEEHDTSYFAPSANMASLFIKTSSIKITSAT
jgi:hypothetical protein